MNRRVVLIVLDGTGVGSMPDCKDFRHQDIGCNTIKNVVTNHGDYPTLKKLGLFNIAEGKFKSEIASTGRFKLAHYGADTFFGHQEIMGSKPQKPHLTIVDDSREKIAEALGNLNIPYSYDKYFLVNQYVVISDNLEADYGQIINVSASTSDVTFDEILRIAKIVRKVVTNSRVIALGGSGTNIERIISSIKRVADCRVGVNTPESGIYEENYRYLQLGYKINYENQLPYLLKEKAIPVSLIGKMQDVIQTPNVWRKPAINTNLVLGSVISRLKDQKNGLIAATVQETDLAGHSQDVNKFQNVLKVVDTMLKEVIESLEENDYLIVTADHGNDPSNESSAHTREFTPLIYFSKNSEVREIGERETLSDIGKTIADIFEIENNLNGKSFK